ncbi:MAG: type III-A CRISPR-associated RAMP protein Csm3 [Methanobrevibacter sp.]|jgi:CRISPR-associated protein Csm3|nr:type III-A CRISPR-associated RAMP protein Csm3 [Methanobrevibacter sp.]
MFKENYLIEGKIVLKTGLHIGDSKDSIEIGVIDNPIIRDKLSGLPFIPGSSLKGKLRSLLELNDKKSAENVIASKGKPSSDSNSKAGKIFGTSASNNNKPDFPTRIIVRDSFPSKEAIEKWDDKEDIVRGAEVKYENTINRITSEANPRPTERIPKDSIFDFEIILSVYDEDGDNENLGGVFESMLLLEDNYLGGSGSRGYGQIKFDKITLKKRDSNYYKEKLDEEIIAEDASISDIIEKINK